MFSPTLIGNYSDLSSVFCVWTPGSVVFTWWKLMWILIDQTNAQHSICKSLKRDGCLRPIAANNQPSGTTTCLQVDVAQYSPAKQTHGSHCSPRPPPLPPPTAWLALAKRRGRCSQGHRLLMCCPARRSRSTGGCKSADNVTFSLTDGGQVGRCTLVGFSPPP